MLSFCEKCKCFCPRFNHGICASQDVEISDCCIGDRARIKYRGNWGELETSPNGTDLSNIRSKLNL